MAMVLPFTGFRFRPTDDELVVAFLEKKVAGEDVPPAPIHELDVYSTEPWNLASSTIRFEHGEMSNGAYFFTPRHPVSKRGGRGGRVNRNAGIGFWHGKGRDGKIVVGSRLVAHKTALNFRMKDGSRCPGGEEWIMHEYRLHGGNGDGGGFQPIALCKIHKKLKPKPNPNPNPNPAPPAALDQDQNGEPPCKRARFALQDSSGGTGREEDQLALTTAAPTTTTLLLEDEDQNFAAMGELEFTFEQLMAGWGDLFLEMPPPPLPQAMQLQVQPSASPPPAAAAAAAPHQTSSSSLTAALASLEDDLFVVEDDKLARSSDHLYYEFQTLVY